jgi:hypothetical protein
MNNKRTMSFQTWYDHLQQLAARHGESVADQAAWRESYEEGDNLNEAFYSEYPEHLDTPVA